MTTHVHAPLKARIEFLVQADLNACTELLALLQAEREALTERKLPELVEIIEAKAKTIDLLDAQAQERREILAGLQRPSEESEWQALVKEVDDEALNQSWEELREMLTECKRFNEVNGRMISRGKQTLGKLLTLLRGQNIATDLYNAQGESQGQYSSHTVVKV